MEHLLFFFVYLSVYLVIGYMFGHVRYLISHVYANESISDAFRKIPLWLLFPSVMFFSAFFYNMSKGKGRKTFREYYRHFLFSKDLTISNLLSVSVYETRKTTYITYVTWLWPLFICAHVLTYVCVTIAALLFVTMFIVLPILLTWISSDKTLLVKESRVRVP